MSEHDVLHDHDLGLSHDLPRILGRRRLLTVLGGVGATVAVAACGSDDGTSPTGTSGGQGEPSSQTDATVADEEIPEETAGPFPGDGSNGPDALGQSGVVRSDITRSFGDASGTAEGVPLTIRLKIHDVSGEDVSPYAGAAVYLWHCSREGEYSMYSENVTDENFLRGVQAADGAGALAFTSIFPAAYDGRWPHIHFEVYPTLDDATSAGNRLRTSQIALPEDVCKEVYENADGYDASVANLARTSLATDLVFADGYSLQMATLTGNVEQGFVATLNVPV
jgi:protocatechuate 3,4-dioxygenase beta subunit